MASLLLRKIFGSLVCLVRGHEGMDERTEHDRKYGRICFCVPCVFWRQCQRCTRWVQR